VIKVSEAEILYFCGVVAVTANDADFMKSGTEL